MGTAIRLWARTELRRRWRTLVVLGILAGLAGGIVLAAVAGARRTATAYDRYREAVDAPDAIVFGTQVGLVPADYSAVRALPEVEAAGEFTLAPIAVERQGLSSLPPGDDKLFRTLSRPLLTSGRLPDPARDDEIVVNRAAHKRHGLDVGDRVTVSTALDIDAFFGGGVYDGPKIRATVVGVGDSMIDHIFTGGEDGEPGFAPSAGLLAKHPEIPRAGNLVVKLKPGTDIEQFRARAQEAVRTSNHDAMVESGSLEAEIPVRDSAEDRKRFVHGTDLERTALLLFAVAAALAGFVLVGQAIARAVYSTADSHPALRALGFTRRASMAGLVAPILLTALVAAAVALAFALALSSQFPIGLAADLEPDRGLRADWLVLGIGAAAVLVAVVATATLAAVRATWAQPDESLSLQPTVVRTIRNAAPLPVGLGAALALDPGRGRRTVPVRPAIAGGVAGVLGIVGALGLVRGIDDAVAEPSRSGQAWDLWMYTDQPGQIDAMKEMAVRERDVEAAALSPRSPLDIAGAGVPGYALESVKGNLSFVVLEGRAPAGPDEAAVAPSTLKAIGKAIGDRAVIGEREVRIVGEALLPQTAHSSFDQGVWMTPEGLEQVAPEQQMHEIDLLVRAREGADLERLKADFADVSPEAPEDASIPQDVILLRNVRTVPRALAAFLALLGIAALGHALVTTVRRRRHDFAVLRALGMRPGQARATIAWQATTVGVVALLFGIPLGIAAGRVSWRWVAESTPLLYVAPIAVAAVLLAIPGAIFVANALAAWPARRAGRIRPAVVLRTE